MSINETIQIEIAAAEALIAQAQARIEALNTLATDVATLMKFASRVSERIKLLPKDEIASFKESLLALFDESPHSSEEDTSYWEQWQEKNGSMTNLRNVGEPLLAEILDDSEPLQPQSQPESNGNGNLVEIGQGELNGHKTWNGHTPTPRMILNGNGHEISASSEAYPAPDSSYVPIQDTHSVVAQEYRIKPEFETADPSIAHFVRLLSQVQTPEDLQAIMSQRLAEGVDPQVLDEALPPGVRKKVRELASQLTA